jgi:hypothetical protein
MPSPYRSPVSIAWSRISRGRSAWTNEDSYSPTARLLARKLQSHGASANVVMLKDTGHIGTVMALGTPGSELSNAILDMIDATRGKSPSAAQRACERHEVGARH